MPITRGDIPSEPTPRNRRSNSAQRQAITRREFVVLTTGAIAASVLTGCGGGGTGEDMSLLGRGSVRGFLYRSPAGALSVGYTATPPVGYQPVIGATVAVAGADSQVVSGADGGFLLANVPSGLRRLDIMAQGGPLRVPLTVLHNATIVVGDPPVTRQEAVSVAKAEAAKTVDVSGARVIVPQQPLPAGVKIIPALLRAANAPSPDAMEFATPQWLVLIDLHPGARWGHDVVYVFVDAGTGATSAQVESSWPELNRCWYYRNQRIAGAGQDLVEAGRSAAAHRPTPAVRREIVRSATTRDHMEGCGDPRTFALLVAGDPWLPTDEGVQQIRSLIGVGALPRIGALHAITSRDYAAPRQEVLDRWSLICNEADYCDYVLFYVTSHGMRPDPAHGRPYYCAVLEAGAPTPDGALSDKERHENLFPFDLDWSKCKACHVVIVVDTCYAGGWITTLRDSLAALPGREVVVLASSRSDLVAWAADSGETVDVNGRRTVLSGGGLYTTALTRSYLASPTITGFYSALATAHGNAAVITDQWNASPTWPEPQTAQSPQAWSRDLIPDEECGCGSASGTIQ